MSQRQVEVYPDPPALLRATAIRIATIAEAAIATRGRFTIALCGGSTPRGLYQMLATDEFLTLIDWSRAYVFWGDERCVPPDHPDSNYGMARKALLDFTPIPLGNVFRMHGEIEPEAAARQYEARLREFFGGRAELTGLRARFDIVLLGLGSDGHTASLFPHTAAVHETERLVVAHHVEAVNAWRLTLTPPALNETAHGIFFVMGEEKADAIHAVIEGAHNPDAVPAHIIAPTNGQLTFYIDQNAARRITPPHTMADYQPVADDADAAPETLESSDEALPDDAFTLPFPDANATDERDDMNDAEGGR